MAYRKVVDFERREKGGYNERRIYSHWWLVRLDCGHRETAKPVKGGACPKTVNCRHCSMSKRLVELVVGSREA